MDNIACAKRLGVRRLDAAVEQSEALAGRLAQSKALRFAIPRQPTDVLLDAHLSTPFSKTLSTVGG